MGKFNTSVKERTKKTVNLAGGQAYKTDAKLELVGILLSSLLKEQFYRTEQEQKEALFTVMEKVDPIFIAKAAIYARNEFGMRSISHVAAAYIAAAVKGQRWTKNFLSKVVRRPDDITEILSFYRNHVDKVIPNSMKKGLGDALTRFDEYALGKYAGKKDGLSMIDVVNLLHPKHTVAIGKLMKGKLQAADTWETAMSRAGQAGEDTAALKADEWRRLLTENKLGYMALVRNIRNIMEQAPDMVDVLCERLVDAEAIKKSLMFPFRFITALDIVENLSATGVRRVIRALSDAVDISLCNAPKFDGETLVAIDCSGSMSGQPGKIATLFGAMMAKTNDCDVLIFDDSARYVNLNTADSTLTIASKIPFPGGGTDFKTIFRTANKKYDRVVIFSDMQSWVGHVSPVKEFNDYKQRFNCNPRIFSFDLQGYGTLQFPQDMVYQLFGWSDKAFEVMKALEEDRNGLIHKIESIELAS